ncbi:hypothetical protein ABPG74_020836 [Tetrahymena malaccensis]
MNKQFIQQIPSYLKEFHISDEDIKKQQKWIEQKIMLSFQSSLSQILQEKISQEFNSQISNAVDNQVNEASSFQFGNKLHKVSNQKQNVSQNMIDIHLIRSQMKINQKEYPKLFPEQQQFIERAKGDQVLKTISQSSYIRHNISTQSTNIPPTSINNRHFKNDESLNMPINEDEISAFYVHPQSTQNLNSNNNNFFQNKCKRNIHHKKSHSNVGQAKEYSYAEQQKKKKQFQLNSSLQGTSNNVKNSNTNVNNSFSYSSQVNQNIIQNCMLNSNYSSSFYNPTKKSLNDINI